MRRTCWRDEGPSQELYLFLKRPLAVNTWSSVTVANPNTTSFDLIPSPSAFNTPKHSLLINTALHGDFRMDCRPPLCGVTGQGVEKRCDCLGDARVGGSGWEEVGSTEGGDGEDDFGYRTSIRHEQAVSLVSCVWMNGVLLPIARYELRKLWVRRHPTYPDIDYRSRWYADRSTFPVVFPVNSMSASSSRVGRSLRVPFRLREGQVE